MLFGKKLSLSILFLIVFATTICSIVHAKSVYVITDRYSTVKAYDIQGGQIDYQTDAKNLAHRGGGAVGQDN